MLEKDFGRPGRSAKTERKKRNRSAGRRRDTQQAKKDQQAAYATAAQVVDLERIQKEDKELFKLMGVIEDFYSDRERPSNASSLMSSMESVHSDSSDEEGYRELYKKYPDLKDSNDNGPQQHKLCKQLKKVMLKE